MDRSRYQQYFVQPVETSHRRYEALRAVFVEERTMKEVAQQFALNHGTVRNWVSEFRQQQDAGLPPLFSPPQLAGVHTARLSFRMMSPPSKSPMSKPCRWSQDAG